MLKFFCDGIDEIGSYDEAVSDAQIEDTVHFGLFDVSVFGEEFEDWRCGPGFAIDFRV